MPKPGPVVCAEAWSRSEARPPVACRNPAGRVRRSLAAGRVPKPGRAPVTARRAPARPGAALPRGEVRSGPARPSGGRETGKTASTMVEITCGCRRMTDRARHFAKFWKQIEKNDKVLSVYGGSVLRIEKNGKVRRAGRSSRAFVAHGQSLRLSRGNAMVVRVIWPTFGKSRKTTKSYPSTWHQFCESRKTANFDAPVGLLERVSRTGSKYDSLEEAQWPYASFCQLSENRGKRQSPIRLRGISWGNENFCLNLFQQSSVPCRADRWVNCGSNKEPLI